jgi:serine/threonine protein kinase
LYDNQSHDLAVMPDNTNPEDDIFERALLCSPGAERATFLDRECRNDSQLRARIELMLEGHEAADFLDNLPHRVTPERAPGSAPRPQREQLGSKIGPYKLLQKLGEGGCGLVYLAEQDHPVRRRVAVKVIKLGMDTRSVIARFEAERQALALMDHPNIAKVFDAGATETGRPYFAMELVRGIRVSEYCDKNNLSTDQRLTLFIQVCHAIQHAHQKGVIHRDIKPSNILVTLHDGVPVPKVIDFGIAKATCDQRLTDRTIFTAFEQFIGTPAYMSPEQAEMSGWDIDTRSDIYSLGVLLYELLTGSTPFDAKELLASGLDAMRRTIREQEAVRPSTMFATLRGDELVTTAQRRSAEPARLVHELTGDLDWIIMKCLEKDRTRRYETANGLAADLKRHLNNEPVIARPPSTAYKLQKAWHRNKLAFTAAAAVLCALILGVVVSTWQAVRATQAEREQSRLRREAEGLRANEARLRREAEARATIFQANLLLSQGKFEEADKLIGETSLVLTQPSVEGAATLRALGEWHADAGRWQQAAARFASALQLNHFDGADLPTMDFLKCGTLLIEVGNIEGYERLRQAAIARFGDSDILYVGERIAKVSLLLPAGNDVIRSLAPLAALQTNVEFDPLNRYRSEMAAWTSLSLALLEYRRDNQALAVEWCGRSLAFSSDSKVRIATARIVLAMSRHQLQQADAARSELAQGRAIIESKFRSGLGPTEDIFGRWFDWLIARILLREATALIDGK